MEKTKTFLGLDIGTNSVGWAVTDDNYKLRKFRNNLMWGVHLFDEAQQATERRSFRTARRRLDRRKLRITLLQEFFAPEIIKIDPSFFFRLKESALFPEDSEHRTKNILFDDKDYTDKDYYKKYPTIHHLIVELMNSSEPHDIRLVYLACAYLLKYRGHFLFDVDLDNVDKVTDFDEIYAYFYSALGELCDNIPFEGSAKETADIIKKHISITEKDKLISNLWFPVKKPKKDEYENIRFDCLSKLLSGRKTALSELFINDDYKELEKDSIQITSADFSETLDGLHGQIEDNEWELLLNAQKLSDWGMLINSIGGSDNLSEKNDYVSTVKVRVYNTHKNDLANLKYIFRKYLKKEKYNEIFRSDKIKNNYTAYVDSPGSCSQEDFCKYIKGFLNDITVQSQDTELLDELKRKCELASLCPKQVTSDNRVIPYQLYYSELKKILENAAGYLYFLNTKDQYGTVADKILSIMRFKIPYYVGPLVSEEKSKFAWMKRKAEGRIYPWNFDEIVDHEESENEFIYRMTCKCSYLFGEDVLPKNSLLYSKFVVLNEINNLTINGEKISVEMKQRIYNELFMKKKKVSRKDIEKLLISCGELKEGQVIGGIDITVKSSLKPYHDFKNLIKNGILTEKQAEEIIKHITVTTDKKRLKKWLEDNYKLSKDDVNYISGLSYRDYGRLSRKLLEEIFEIDTAAGEMIDERNIITRLWETNENLMQLLSSKYKYSDNIKKINTDELSEGMQSLAERMKDMYISPAVRRSITRTVDIVKELKGILGKDPDKIFIEMPREHDDKQKGKRTTSRRKNIEDLYKSAKDLADKKRIEELTEQLASVDDGKLRSEKYYLYFIQLGRCMYTGDVIDFDKLSGDTYYNIDHIFPQAKVKDDSLDNKVLVGSEINGVKKDIYPISSDIRKKMFTYWSALKGKNLITEKKYQRLIRSTPFSDDELAGFIARQLVETRQSAKAAAEIIKDLCPNSDIVYVKAGLVSEFRQEMDMLKCREINDLHHAKDAYLNIVVGNVYDVQFTKNPLNFVREHPKYSIKLFKKDSIGNASVLLAKDVERSGVKAWEKDKSFEMVRRMMSKNSIRYVRYSFMRKGGFFKQTIKKRESGLIQIKKGLDTEKYGGYNSATITFFTLIRYKKDIMFVPIELMYMNAFINNTNTKKVVIDSMRNIFSANKMKNISDSDIQFVSMNGTFSNDKPRIIKINTLFEIDGLRFSLKGKNDSYMSVALADSLVVDKDMEAYLKKLGSFVKRYNDKQVESADYVVGITDDMNVKLYKYLAEKCLSVPFNKWAKFIEAGNTMLSKIDTFRGLQRTQQALAIMKCLEILKTGRSTAADLGMIGSVKNFHTERISFVIDKKKNKSFYIIDQSPTGLYEKRSVNLLDL